MAERLLDRGLNTLVSVASLGRFGVEVTPEFREFKKQLKNEDRSLATRIYDSGTLIVIDNKNQRIITRYRLVKRPTRRNPQRGDWNPKSSRKYYGDSSFQEGTGKTLEEHLFPKE